MDKHEFATMIADNEKRWSELAREFEVALTTVRRWSIGVSRPMPRLQRLIADYLIVSIKT